MAQTKLISDAEQAGDHVDGAGLSSFHNLTPRQQEVFDLLVAWLPADRSGTGRASRR